MPSSPSLRKAAEKVREFALGFPGAWEDFPWDERVVKVGKKVFVFLGHDADDEFGLTVKLPESREAALTLPYTEVPGYGLGKANWVTARFAKGDRPDVELLFEWIDESYRAIAPKTLVKQLDAR